MSQSDSPMRLDCYTQAYASGVRAVERIATEYDHGDWCKMSTCASWSALDVLRHLHLTALESHTVLEHALRWGPKEVMTEEELLNFNHYTLKSTHSATPQFHTGEFVSSAILYLERIRDLARLPCYSYRGRVWDVEHSIGVLAVEWHVHAWDLAETVGKVYAPRSPGVLADAFCRGTTYLAAPIGPTWGDVLRASGRVTKGRFL